MDSFENIHRYYYCDLSRREKDLKAAKSVTLVGLNNNKCSMDLFIYVIYEKNGLIDCETGQLKM